MLWLIKLKLLRTTSSIICHAGNGTALVRDGNLVHLEIIHLMKSMKSSTYIHCPERMKLDLLSVIPFMIYLKSHDTLKYLQTH